MATQVALTGIMKHGDATADADRMTFVPTHTMYDAAGLVIVRAGEPTYATPNTTTGAWSKTLYANDDPTTSPTGTGYAIYQGKTFLGTFVVPYTATLGTVSLASLTPATITANISYASQAALNSEITTRAAAVTSEATTRGAADTALSASVDAVKAGFSFVVVGANVAATQTVPLFLFRAPAACTLTYAAMVNNSNQPLGSSINWTMEVRRYRAGTPVVIATKTTDSDDPAAEAMTANALWEVNPATFDSSNKVFAAGDLLAFFLLRGGSAAAITVPQYVIGYTLS